MTWNYRLVRHKDNYLYYHEVHYKNDKPCSIAENEISFFFEDVDEIGYILIKLLEAKYKPIFVPPKSWGWEK